MAVEVDVAIGEPVMVGAAFAEWAWAPWFFHRACFVGRDDGAHPFHA